MKGNTQRIFDDIYLKQTELMHKYGEIEGLPDWPADIDDKEIQVWVKDFMWRVVEELGGEFLEANYDGKFEHSIEELADCLHFLTEIYIFLGFEITMTPDALVQKFNLLQGEHKTNEAITLKTIHHLALAGNCLKNKRWKQTFVFTDKHKFLRLLNEAFKGLIFLFLLNGIDPQGIYEAYFRKHEINKNRQENNY